MFIRMYVSIPFKRESISKGSGSHFVSSQECGFQFPSNGKAYPKSHGTMQAEGSTCFNSLQTGKHIQRMDRSRAIFRDSWFQFPSNGKAYPKSPYFKPSGAVAPRCLKQTRTARGIFSLQNSPQKSHKPTCTLKQTRFFRKNGLEPRHHLRSWAI